MSYRPPNAAVWQVLRIHRVKQLVVALNCAAATIVLLLVPGGTAQASADTTAVATHAPGPVLYGRGTATIDGVAGGEWADARRLSFEAARPPYDGGGTMPVTLMAMNDDVNVYFAVIVGRGAVGGTTQALLYFDNNGDGQISRGDEHLAVDAGTYSAPSFFDGFWNSCVPGGPAVCPTTDISDGGSTDGAGAVAANGATTTLEFSHPLASADTAHDWRVGPGSSIGFALVMNIFSLTPACNFGPECQTDTLFPPGSLNGDSAQLYGNLVIAPDTIAPETTITEGPEDASVTASTSAHFAYGGTDNLTSPNALAFDCSLDGEPFGPCRQDVSVKNGHHVFKVRARDELGNADTTPATRNWRVDTSAPTKPIIAARVQGRRVDVLVRSRDADDDPRALKFSCTLDGHRIGHCGPQFTITVTRGAHTLAATVRDALGNQSPLGRCRFSAH
jgi:hypothetical protein